MALTDLLVKVAEVLPAHGIRFVLIGGMAVATWVEPRLTRDVDIVVLVRKRESPRLKQALLEIGARVTALEMRLLFDRRFVRLKAGESQLDVHVASSALDHAALARAARVEYQGRTLLVATPEDLVLYKLVAWRPHDQVDVGRLLHETRDLDLAYIQDRLAGVSKSSGIPLGPRWEQARALPPP
ncbi:MAG: nucleotidyl transferase AbiEii/AbiGii toxin family protein [Planctomycetes bacterium]|nr:nucleotidyl transferase AbiEii/AbiGii toxin family protein [Planctomycetota bacterium]